MDIKLSLFIKNKMYHEGISLYLSQQYGFNSITQHDGLCEVSDFINHPTRLEHDLILLTDGNAHHDLSAIAKLKRRWAELRVVMVMYAPNQEFVRTCISMGIEGVVTGNDSMQDLKTCIFTVESGHICYPRDSLPFFSQAKNEEIGFTSNIPKSFYDESLEDIRGSLNLVSNSASFLTSKQLRVIQLIEKGLSNKEIARTLNIELSTVKNHVHRILDKLHVKSRCEAASWFRQAQ